MLAVHWPWLSEPLTCNQWRPSAWINEGTEAESATVLVVCCQEWMRWFNPLILVYSYSYSRLSLDLWHFGNYLGIEHTFLKNLNKSFTLRISVKSSPSTISQNMLLWMRKLENWKIVRLVLDPTRLTGLTFSLFTAGATFIQGAIPKHWKLIRPCLDDIHWKALAENFLMSTSVPVISYYLIFSISHVYYVILY